MEPSRADSKSTASSRSRARPNTGSDNSVGETRRTASASGVTSFADGLVRHRNLLGMTQNAAAEQIGVDPTTLARWERDEREPTGTYTSRVERFLGGGTNLLRRAG